MCRPVLSAAARTPHAQNGAQLLAACQAHESQKRRTLCAAAAAAAEDLSRSDEAHWVAPPLQIYNTMRRKQQTFTARPGNGNAVSMYVCGVTVYDFAHIGHARVYVAFDVLLRVLRHAGFDVTYVRNFTDIDDKIIKRAAEAGEDPLALSSRFIEEFHTDMAALGCLEPTLEPKATEHVQDMVDTIQRIIDNGHAYVAGSDVFFDVQSLSGYGRLSRQALEDSKEGAHESMRSCNAH
jgi:cysteinyl-tRNA synthetase